MEYPISVYPSFPYCAFVHLLLWMYVCNVCAHFREGVKIQEFWLYLDFQFELIFQLQSPLSVFSYVLYICPLADVSFRFITTID